MHSPHLHIARILEQSRQAKDLVLLRSILADDVVWHEEPFEPPLTSADAVVAVWKKDLAKQNNLQVQIELLDVADSRSYHRCIASWTDTDNKAHMFDGIFKIDLRNTGTIAEFAMWYASR